MSKPIDMGKIKENIGKKHSDFLKSVGDIAIKVSADNELLLTRMASKISFIVHLFVSEKVIDDCNSLEDSTYKGFHLTKRGFPKSVYIWTDGKDIIMKDSSLAIRHGIGDSEVESLYDVDIEEMDWEGFSDKLLDYIHKFIYERKEVMERKVFGW